MVCAPVRRDNPRALACTIIFSVDLAHYGVSCAKDSVFVDCSTSVYIVEHLRIRNCFHLVYLTM